MDIVHGGAGDDLLEGGSGTDGLGGDAGNDQLFGSEDTDVLVGEDGYDLLDGGFGLDYAVADYADVYYVDLYGETNQGIGGYGYYGAAQPTLTLNHRASTAIRHAAFVLMHRNWLFSEPQPAAGIASPAAIDAALANSFKMQYGADHRVVSSQATTANLAQVAVRPAARANRKAPVVSTVRAARSPLAAFISAPAPSTPPVASESKPYTVVYVPDSQYVEESRADWTDEPSVPEAYYGVGLYGNLNGGFFSYPTTPLNPATEGLIYQFKQYKNNLLALNNDAAFTQLAQEDLKRQLPGLFGG
jgi:hypothetical protein